MVFPPIFFTGILNLELEIKRSNLEQKFFELTEKIVHENNYALYDVEYHSGSSTLRVFIMDPETKTAVIEDCVKVDRAFDPYCETESWIPEDFTLEVSSPGVYRNIRSKQHFESALGEIISVTLSGQLRQDLDLPNKIKKNKKLRGKLLKLENEHIELEVEQAPVQIPFEVLKKASLDPDLNGSSRELKGE